MTVTLLVVTSSLTQRRFAAIVQHSARTLQAFTGRLKPPYIAVIRRLQPFLGLFEAALRPIFLQAAD